MYHLAPWSGRDFGSEAMHVVDKAFVHNLLKFCMHISYLLVGRKGFDFQKKNKARWESWCPTQASITSQLRRQGDEKDRQGCPQGCPQIMLSSIIYKVALILKYRVVWGCIVESKVAQIVKMRQHQASIRLGWKSHNWETNINLMLKLTL